MSLIFLFTDIQDSTRLWEKYPEAMRHALERHDALLQQAVEESGGRVVKMTGDGCLAVFPVASCAVAASLQAQRALYANEQRALAVFQEVDEATDLTSLLAQDPFLPLRVRMAIHVGEAQERGNDFYGPTLNRTARLMAIGHGGQVLLSEATYDLAKNALPEDCSLRDLGLHGLKDLEHPERVFQLLSPALPSTFPALKSRNTLPNNLPRVFTSFVGREREMQRIRQLLIDAPLVTLTGFGGCGKTRLALQVAADLLEKYPDGVFLVELAPLTEGHQIYPQIARALGLREEPGHSLIDTLRAHLQDKALLLLLDNCEHLVEVCAQCVQALLQERPALRILAASREALGLSWEALVPVEPLSLIEAPLASANDKLPSEAVQLFVERVHAVRPDWIASQADWGIAQRICQRLDGIPLAVELAAARAKYMPLRSIDTALDDLFEFLVSQGRDVSDRQKSLDAMIAWSYDRLTQEEKRFWRSLSIFTGGWTPEAAQRIFGAQSMTLQRVRTLLFRLVDRSLVIPERQGSETRYRLLEVLRQYGRERCEEAGEREPLSDRHLAWYTQAAEEAERRLHGPEQILSLQHFEQEEGNWQAALHWAVEREDPGEEGTRLAGALWRFWSERGHLSEGRRWLTFWLNAPGFRRGAEAESLRAKLLHGAGTLSIDLGEYAAAQDYLEESLAIRRAKNDLAQVASTLLSLGGLAYAQSNLTTACRLFEESLALRQTIEDHGGEADARVWLGNVAYRKGDFLQAYELYQNALTSYTTQQIPLGAVKALLNMSTLAHALGRFEEARRFYGDCLERTREWDLLPLIAHTRNNLGNLFRQMEDYEQAGEHLTEALALYRKLNNKSALAGCLFNLAVVAYFQNETSPLYEHARESLAIYQGLQSAEGIALALESFGGLCALMALHERAATLLSAAQALRQRAGTTRDPVDSALAEAVLRRVKTALAPVALEQASLQGEGMTEEQAVTCALATRLSTERLLFSTADLLAAVDFSLRSSRQSPQASNG